jgi:hypothetical protein
MEKCDQFQGGIGSNGVIGRQHPSNKDNFAPASLALETAPNSKSNALATDSSAKDKKPLLCIRDTESYAFLICWTIANYFIILLFAILLLTWYDIDQKSRHIRIRILEIIR